MKRIYILVVTLFIATALNAQNLIVGGNMESGDSWTVLNVVPADKTGEDATVEFGYSEDRPGAGKDGCLKLTHAPGGSGTWSNTAIFQAVKIKTNTRYVLSAAFKNIDNFKGAWAEFQYSTWKPVGGGQDWTGDGVVTLANFMDPGWGSACAANTYDVLIKDACETANGEDLIVYVEGVEGEEITIYIGVKIGDNGNADALEFLIDEFSLVEEVVVEDPNLIVGGNMESGDAWTVLNVVPADKTGEDATVEFGYSEDRPGAGKDGCLKLTHAPGGSGTWSNTAIFQAVKIKTNTRYVLSAAFKNIDNFKGAWAEFQYSTWKPVGGGQDWTGDGVVTLANFMDPGWGSACAANTYDVLIKDACETANGEDLIVYVEGVEGEEITIYIGVKIGDNGNADALEFLIDEFSLVEEVTTSINEFEFEEALKVYPNPASNKIRIENAMSNEIQIYNMLGRLVYSKIVNNSIEEIDISTYKSGIYIVRSGSVTTKFIKN